MGRGVEGGEESMGAGLGAKLFGWSLTVIQRDCAIEIREEDDLGPSVERVREGHDVRDWDVVPAPSSDL